MKLSCAILAAFATVLAFSPQAHAQPQTNLLSRFTYQGSLQDWSVGQGDDPRLSGWWQFHIVAVLPPCLWVDCGWDPTNVCPNCLSYDLGTNTTLVNKGVFTLPLTIPQPILASPTGVFLQFAVRSNGVGPFTILSPMQPLTSTPYAAIAQSVVGPVSASLLTGPMPTGMLTGVFSSPVTFNNPSNVFAGDGSLLTRLQAGNLIGTMPTGMLTGVFSSPVTFSNPNNVFAGDGSLLTHLQAGNLVGTMPTGMLTGVFSSPVTFNNPSNVFAGDGSLLTHVNAATIGGLDACNLPCYWKLTGNSGTDPNVNFVGTTDSAALVARVNNTVALRLLPSAGTPNLIGGYAGNQIPLNDASVISGGGRPGFPNVIVGETSTIGGGFGNTIGALVGNTYYAGRASFIGSGSGNSIAKLVGNTPAEWDVISGGNSNSISGLWSAIVGGAYNSITGDRSSIGGGAFNVANADQATIAGGVNNVAGSAASVGGGWANSAEGLAATVPGGSNNVATGATSLAAGNRAKAVHDGAFVWSDSQNADFASTANNQFAVRAQNGVMIQGTTTTLDLRGNGAIRVAGAGVASSGPVFVHRATAANTSAHITTIDNPLANGDPNAILLVTHNYSADTSATPYETTPVDDLP